MLNVDESRPVKRPRRRGRADTREAILKTAEEMFAAHGYHGTSLQKLAAKVGIRKASLFHHFKNKQSIYEEVTDRATRELEDKIRGAISGSLSFEERLLKLIETYIESVATHPGRAHMLVRAALDQEEELGRTLAEHARPIIEAITDFISQGQDARVFRRGDPMFLIIAVMGIVIFSFISAPMLAPAWLSDAFGPQGVARIKQETLRFFQAALIPGRQEVSEAC